MLRGPLNEEKKNLGGGGGGWGGMGMVLKGKLFRDYLNGKNSYHVFIRVIMLR